MRLLVIRRVGGLEERSAQRFARIAVIRRVGGLEELPRQTQ